MILLPHRVVAHPPAHGPADASPGADDLHAIPDGVEAVVIGTRPEHAQATMRECEDLGIEHVCMHRLNGAGSFSKEAADYGREHGITVIDGGCPLMFEPTSDRGHKVMRWAFTLSGHVPRHV